MTEAMMNSNNSDQIDPLFLSRLVDLGGSKLANELVDMYLVRGNELLDAILRGIETNDLSKVQSAAHSLISSAGNLGGKKVSELAKRIEKSAADQNVPPLPELFSQVSAAQIKFQEYLRGELIKK